MDSLAFLMKVWEKQCKPGDYVAVSTKGNGWHDQTFAWGPNTRRDVEAWLKRTSHINQYFCPLPFTGPERKRNLVRGSRYLWSDIDTGNWAKAKPSVLWESSPGRWAGLWLLPEFVNAEAAEDGSKRMAYAIGADHGGWDLTQVLRIPGTKNYKYVEQPVVRLEHFTDEVLKNIPADPLEKWRKKIPRKLLKIIEGPAEVGKRSDMLWFLEHELCDLGIPLRDVFAILKESDWNKYRGRSDEGDRFKAEMDKIKEDRAEKKVATKTEAAVDFKVQTLTQLLQQPNLEPGWLVKDWWMKGSHGIVAGEPKSFKSTLVQDLLISIASGTPFLGEYEVVKQGPVLMVQNENTDAIMSNRSLKMLASKGVIPTYRNGGHTIKLSWPTQVTENFHMISQQGFQLDDIEHQEQIESLIEAIKPVVVCFDPLYLMFSGDINSAKDLNAALQWLLYLKQEYKTSILLIHHYSKNKEGIRGGQRMLGSTTLHGWIESAWYLQTQEQQNGHPVVTMEREFRAAQRYQKMDVEIDLGEWSDFTYNLKLAEHVDSDYSDDESVENQVIAVLSTATDLMAKSRLAKEAGISRDKTDRILDNMVGKGLIFRKGERYGLPTR